MNDKATNILARAPAATRDAAEPSLLFFFSSTSGSSRRLDGFLAQVLQRRANHSTFRLIRIDGEQRPDLMKRLRVTDLPTLLVFDRGRVRGRLTTPSGCRQITHLLTPWPK